MLKALNEMHMTIIGHPVGPQQGALLFLLVYSQLMCYISKIPHQIIQMLQESIFPTSKLLEGKLFFLTPLVSKRRDFFFLKHFKFFFVLFHHFF